MHAYFEEAHLAETERLLGNNDQRGFCKHLMNMVGLKGTKARSKQFIRDEDGTPLREKVRIRERWSEFCHKLRNTKSLKLDPTIIDLATATVKTVARRRTIRGREDGST